MAAILLEFTERIHESSIHESAESGPFLGCESMVLHIRLGVRKVDLSVSDVQITTKDDRFPLLQPLQVTFEVRVPALAVRQASEFTL